MTATAALFSALVASVSVMLVAGVHVAFGRSGRATALGAVVVAGWLAATAMLARSGVLHDWSTLPPTFVRIMGGCALSCVLLVLSPLGRRLAQGVPLTALIGMQVFRFPVELLLHRLHVEGLAPVQMTYLGRNVDVVPALLALPVAYLVAKRGEHTPFGRRLALAFNVLGLGTLLNIVAVAILSVPGPLRAFHNEPANTFVTTVPYVWLPTVLVLTALLGHLLVFRRVRVSAVGEGTPGARAPRPKPV